LRPGGDLQRLDGGHTAQLRTAEGGHVSEAVDVQPARRAVAEQHRADRVHAAGQALAGDDDVRVDAVFGDAPQLTGAHQPGLHLVGDVEGAEAFGELFDRLEVTRWGKRESVRRGDGLHD